ncbi:MAG: mucin 2 [Gammaproteobacteria bacterium]|nr:MAG: mucin 2 [Gammaproteobacteria bacterium]
MKITKNTKWQIKIQNAIFYLLLIIAVVLLAQVSLKTDISADWTQNNRHSLSLATTDFLEQLETDIVIQVFVSPNYKFKDALESLLKRYQTKSSRLKISYIDPEFSPSLVRQYNIQQQAEMVVTLGQQQARVYDLSEQSLSNALISVSRHKEPWLVFIEGHGERSPLDPGNSHLSIWADSLKQKGFKIISQNLIENSHIADNTAAVVIASPEQAWLEGEIELIQQYVSDGGNLLWLADPDTHSHLSALAEQLNIEFIAGTVLDPNAELLGINDPRFSLINDYSNHPVGAAVSMVTLFPQAVALEPSELNNQWLMTSLLNTQNNAWSKVGDIDETSELEFNFELGTDTAGPLSLSYLLTRSLDNDEDSEQRIAIVGDSDFVSNTYIGNAANLELGMALLNWLAEDDSLIAIPVKTTEDKQLILSNTQSLVIGLGFLLGLPFILFLVAFIIWRKRRQR